MHFILIRECYFDSTSKTGAIKIGTSGKKYVKVLKYMFVY